MAEVQPAKCLLPAAGNQAARVLDKLSVKMPKRKTLFTKVRKFVYFFFLKRSLVPLGLDDAESRLCGLAA